MLPWLVLLVSLVGNAYLLARPRTPASTKGVAAHPETEPPRDPECAAELESCRRATSRLSLGLWEAAMRPSPGAPPPSSAPAAATPKVETPRESICRVARDKLRDQWLEKRDSISAGLAKDLPDTAKQRSDAERDAHRTAEALGLTGRARRGFEDDYVDLRLRRMVDIAAASQTTPIAWSRILADVQSLFVDEDALVQRELGNEALQRYKDSEKDGRITILSIAATYADADWDETIAGP